jgi:hypothetical protein
VISGAVGPVGITVEATHPGYYTDSYLCFDSAMAPDNGAKPSLKRRVFLCLCGAGLLLIAAAATPEGWAFLNTDGPRRIVVPDPPAIFTYTLVGIAVAVSAFALWMRGRAVSQGLVQRGTRKNSLFSTILLVAVLVALWTTSPTLREWLQERLGGNERRAEQIDSQGNPEAPNEELQRDPSAAYGFAITFILFVVLGIATIGALWLFRPDDPDAGEQDGVGPELAREVERGIEDLGVIADPRAAVIACYARLEAISAASGVAKRPSDTPFEHLGRLLERHNVAGTSARRLTELFERAKFSDKDIDESTRTEAMEALRDVRDQLGVLV